MGLLQWNASSNGRNEWAGYSGLRAAGKEKIADRWKREAAAGRIPDETTENDSREGLCGMRRRDAMNAVRV